MQEYNLGRKIGLFLGPALFIIMLMIGPAEGMKPEAMKVAALTVLMAVWWISEAVPIPATSLLPIVMYPILGITTTKATTASYANPIIYLFMGGFFIAVAMQKYNLHKRIALHVIKMVGSSPSLMILGFMIATGFLSMWVSNTATAMMMVPIGLAVISQVTGHTSEQMLAGSGGKTEMNFAKSLMLAIAYSASIGGIATIIGTPPNAIMVGMMEKMYGVKINFAQWMMFGLPLSIVMMAAVWFLLTKVMFNTGEMKLASGGEVIKKDIDEMGKMTREEKSVLFVFVLAACSWVINGFIKKSPVDDTMIAIGAALLLFIIPTNFKKGQFILDWKTAVKIPWGIVLLFGAGFAVAEGFTKTDLAMWISMRLTSLEGASVLLFVTIAAVLVVFLTEITSNTAIATLLVPIMGSAAVAMGIHPFATIISSCLSASFAFMLPVATPPNAVVFGSGAIKIIDMVKAGIWLNIIGAILIVLFTVYVLPIIWGVDLSVVPEWAHIQK